jgi:hypothetical protein
MAIIFFYYNVSFVLGKEKSQPPQKTEVILNDPKPK